MSKSAKIIVRVDYDTDEQLELITQLLTEETAAINQDGILCWVDDVLEGDIYEPENTTDNG